MQALLALYIATSLLPSNPAARVWGFGPARAALEAVTGPLSNQALAAQIFGLYAGLVYLTPILGGIVGDRVLGGRRTVLLGAAFMASGHFMLAFDATFLVALAALILGSGCLKGNIATQVGRLYAPDDTRRDRAFLLFNLGINIGAFAGPLICGAVGDGGAWHRGFAVAGVGMLVAIAIYLAGWRHLPPDRPRTAIARVPLAGMDRRRTGALLLMIAVALCYNIPFGQSANMVPIWIDAAVDRQVGGHLIPVAWYLACDGLVTVLATPVVILLWKRQAALGREPYTLAKIAIGCALMAVADALLALSAWIAPGDRSVPAVVGIGYFLLASSAYLFVMPMLLTAVSRAAPPHLTATLIGGIYASLFIANLTAGWLARFYQPLGAARFWTIHAAIAAAGIVAALLLGQTLGTAIDRASDVSEPS